MSRAGLIRSALAWAIGVAATFGLTIPGVLIALIPGLRVVIFHMGKAWGKICLWGAGCPVRVEGLDELDSRGRFVIMANHQSALDIPALMSVLPARWRTVFWAKKSLFRIPVLGWAMRTLGHMPVDRIDRSVASTMFSASRQRVGESRSLLVFPEETYGPGAGLLPFSRGGFLFAIKTGLPVLPVGIRGTRAALPPGSRLLSQMTLDVRFGRPIHTTELGVSQREQLSEATRMAIEVLIAEPDPAGG